jgi:curved DNA-binding protein
MSESLYTVLGVARSASKLEIKKAYRKLAGAHHPDHNRGSAVSAAMQKRINHAYTVLTDEATRALYDEFGDDGLRAGFDPVRARSTRRNAKEPAKKASSEQVTRRICFDDLALTSEPAPTAPQSALNVLGDLIGRRARRPAEDYRTQIDVELVETLRGAVLLLERRRGAPVARVFVSPGARDGDVVRVPDLGAPGVNGSLDGDLLVTLRVKPHAAFRCEGDNLLLDLPITVYEAYMGARVTVPTAEGSVALKIPARTQSGTVLRVRGKGIAKRPSNARGDLLVKVIVHVPLADSKELEATLEQLRKYDAPDLRAHIRM